MAAFSEETAAARLQLDCSSAGASSDVIVKVAEAIVNGSKDFISDFVSFAALGRDNRGRAPVSSELRVAVKRACTLLSDVSTHDDNVQLIVKSLSTCIMDAENGREAAKVLASSTRLSSSCDKRVISLACATTSCSYICCALRICNR